MPMDNLSGLGSRPSQRLSIVVPCYNEEALLEETILRLRRFCQEISDLRVEMIFVDDGSRDQTRQILKNHALQDPRIKVLGFARNFGHQIALTAGMDFAQGDAVVLMDADLQDPLEVIPEMVAKWREGFDVVYGTRTRRAGEPLFKLVTAHWFYRLFNRFADLTIPPDTGDFRLMSRAVVDVLKTMPERHRFVRGLVSWVGFQQIALPYERAERLAGMSHYSFPQMVRFAFDGIFSFSTKPLQISFLFGLWFLVLALAASGFALHLFFFKKMGLEGWMILMIALLFIGGVQLITVGLLGEYVARIYNEVKGRPLYVVQEHLGFSNIEEPST